MKRTDVSDYLIHFVRKPNPLDAPKNNEWFDENSYFPLVLSEALINEFDVLINVIKEGGLRANFSFRKGHQTVYGYDPVICFTEMPLINFLQYVLQRNKIDRVSEYGFAILKQEAYKNGAEASP